MGRFRTLIRSKTMEHEIIFKKIQKYKFFSILGIIIFIILILINFYIYIRNEDTCSSSSPSTFYYDPLNLDSFNLQFDHYQGEELSGAIVKALISTLTRNYSTNSDNINKIPSVIFKDSENIISIDCSFDFPEEYEKTLSEIRNMIVIKSTYKIEFEYREYEYYNIIDTIKIEKNDPIIVELD